MGIQNSNTAKTVEVKLLVPYAIIAFMFTVVVSLIVGYFSGIEIRNDVRSSVVAEANQLKDQK
jgi:hypothetical protein